MVIDVCICLYRERICLEPKNLWANFMPHEKLKEDDKLIVIANTQKLSRLK